MNMNGLFACKSWDASAAVKELNYTGLEAQGKYVVALSEAEPLDGKVGPAG